MSGKLTKPRCIDDHVAQYERNVAREAVRSFVIIEEWVKSVTHAMLQITLARR